MRFHESFQLALAALPGGERGGGSGRAAGFGARGHEGVGRAAGFGARGHEGVGRAILGPGHVVILQLLEIARDPLGEPQPLASSILASSILASSILAGGMLMQLLEALRSGLLIGPGRGRGLGRDRPLLLFAPDFERLVVGAGHNRLAVGGEGHRHDAVAVCILVHRLELQGSCRKRGGAQVWAR